MALQIKKFQAPTLQEAIEQIRRELGDDAIILQTEPVKGSGGLFGGNKIEVTAAIDRQEAPIRFQATVGEDATEREAVQNRKPGMLGFLKSAKVKSEQPKHVQAPTKKTPPVVAKAAAPAASSAPTATSSASSTPSLGQLYAMKTYIEPLKEEIDQLKKELKRDQAAPKTKKFKDPLEEEVQQLRSELRDFINERRYEDENLAPYMRQLAHFWKEKGVGEKQMYSLFQQLEGWGQASPENLRTFLEGVIQEADVLQKRDQRIVILVGPTGVGKTTTIAKMAAHEKIRLNRSVALITTDDFKIGGTDQLAHYARILEVPFAKSRSDMTLEDQCKLLTAQTIFVDTFGLSPRDDARMKHLKQMLAFKDANLASKIEIHMVIPVGVSSRDVRDQIELYSELKPQFLAFTKWDETNHWGGMLSAILESKKPVSFISHGQSVPDDFALFSKKSFIETVTKV